MVLNAKEPPTKLSYAVARMLKRVQKPLADFNDKVEDLRNDLCLTDEKTKAVAADANGQFQFTRDNLKKLVEEKRKLLDSDVEIEPYFATELPNNLGDDARVAFEGFVIKGEENAAG